MSAKQPATRQQRGRLSQEQKLAQWRITRVRRVHVPSPWQDFNIDITVLDEWAEFFMRRGLWVVANHYYPEDAFNRNSGFLHFTNVGARPLWVTDESEYIDSFHGTCGYAVWAAMRDGVAESTGRKGTRAFHGSGVYSSPVYDNAAYYAVPHDFFGRGRLDCVMLNLRVRRAFTRSEPDCRWGEELITHDPSIPRVATDTVFVAGVQIRINCHLPTSDHVRPGFKRDTAHFYWNPRLEA